MTLWSEFVTNPGRLVHKWAHYFPIYERHFARFQDRPLLFFEIGCGQGGSLPIWRRFFGPHARIVGLDINPDCKAFEEHQIEVRIGDQSDPKFLDDVIAEFGAPTIVLDDGSHLQDHLNSTFARLYPVVVPDGLYVAEDLHTCYWPEYGGGLKDPSSFMERCKALVDELNGEWTRDGATLTPFTRSTMSITFYDSVVVFEKGAMPRPVAVRSERGTMTADPRGDYGL